MLDETILLLGLVANRFHPGNIAFIARGYDDWVASKHTPAVANTAVITFQYFFFFSYHCLHVLHILTTLRDL